MRISDWSSDVCSSDLLLVAATTIAFLSSEGDSGIADWHMAAGWTAAVLLVFRLVWGFIGGEHARFANFVRPSRLLSDRKSVESGKSVSVRVNLGGGRIIKKKKMTRYPKKVQRR